MFGQIIRILIIALLLMLSSPDSEAHEIVLKNGQVVEGKIFEMFDNALKLKSDVGVDITFYFDEINTIDGMIPQQFIVQVQKEQEKKQQDYLEGLSQEQAPQYQLLEAKNVLYDVNVLPEDYPVKYLVETVDLILAEENIKIDGVKILDVGPRAEVKETTDGKIVLFVSKEGARRPQNILHMLRGTEPKTEGEYRQQKIDQDRGEAFNSIYEGEEKKEKFVDRIGRLMRGEKEDVSNVDIGYHFLTFQEVFHE